MYWVSNRTKWVVIAVRLISEFHFDIVDFARNDKPYTLIIIYIFYFILNCGYKK